MGYCWSGSTGVSTIPSGASVINTVEGWRNSTEGEGDQEPDLGDAAAFTSGGTGLSGISSISRQLFFHSSAKDDEEDDLEVLDDDDVSEDDFSFSFLA